MLDINKATRDFYSRAAQIEKLYYQYNTIDAAMDALVWLIVGIVIGNML